MAQLYIRTSTVKPDSWGMARIQKENSPAHSQPYRFLTRVAL